jgi:hypothetical protein
MEAPNEVEARPSYRDALRTLDREHQAALQQLEDDFRVRRIEVALDYEAIDDGAKGRVDDIKSINPSIITHIRARREAQTPTP